MPGKVLHSGDGGQLEQVEDTDRQYVPAAGDLVTSVGADPPAGSIFQPLGAGHPGVEQGVGHEVVPVGDCLEVLEDLLAERVPTRGDVLELFEHRHIDVRLDVAHHARVAVPVPGTPDAARLVDDADPFDARLAEPGSGQGPGDTPAHDHDVDVVGDRLAVHYGGEGIVTVVGEALVVAQVTDGHATGHEPLVALREVLGTDGLGVEVLDRRI